MKGLKISLLLAAAIPMLQSCLGEGNSQSGFTQYSYPQTAYANTPGGTLAFGSYGAWGLTINGSWITPAITSGNGMTYYSIPLTFAANTTHEMRSATLTLKDNAEDAHLTAVISQYGTRGDGSWGDAPLVRSISGDDGSSIVLTYDQASRPASIKVTKDGSTLRDLTFSWGDSLVVVAGDDSYSVAYEKGYQMPDVQCATDSLYSSYSIDGYSKSFAFQMEEHRSTGEVMGQSALYTGQLSSFPTSYTENGNFIHSSNWPDAERKADSLKCYHKLADGTVSTRYMRLSYGSQDNRYQSVDANQLLLGVEHCNPYLLLGLYRHIRSTALVAEAASAEGKRTVTATLNSDKSVATLTVTDAQGGKVIYTFSY